MTAGYHRDPADRWRGALVALAGGGLIAWAVIAGLAVQLHPHASDALKLFGVLPAPPPPPERIVPRPKQSTRREGAAAPPNIRSKATELVAPPPIVALTPPPIIAATQPAAGFQATSGAAPMPGPGTGAGGIGNGTGSGGAGDGDGDGGAVVPPRQIKGRIDYGDLPAALREAEVQGMVEVRYTIAVDGRVPACRVVTSSGNAALDAATCALIRDRFRFKPARDEDGHPVAVPMIQRHFWYAHEEDER